MDSKNKHMSNGHPDPSHDHKEFFSKVEIPYEKSKDDVWEMMASRLDEKRTSKVVHLNLRSHLLRYAAVFLFLIGVAAFFRFYSNTVHCPRGQHLTAMLPDNSVVEMNAESTLKYYPLWWKFSREVKFEGEGFFKVQKGSRFQVWSEYGKTRVLGTSFNIYSRDINYNVTCLTGSVKVISKSRDKVVLKPNEHAEISNAGKIEMLPDYNIKESIAWMNNMFIFTSVPVADVLREVGRQYDVAVKSGEFDLKYTGYFSKEKPIEEVLSLICKPFGLIFEQQENGIYIVTQN